MSDFTQDDFDSLVGKSEEEDVHDLLQTVRGKYSDYEEIEIKVLLDGEDLMMFDYLCKCMGRDRDAMLEVLLPADPVPMLVGLT